MKVISWAACAYLMIATMKSLGIVCADITICFETASLNTFVPSLASIMYGSFDRILRAAHHSLGSADANLHLSSHGSSKSRMLRTTSVGKSSTVVMESGAERKLKAAWRLLQFQGTQGGTLPPLFVWYSRNGVQRASYFYYYHKVDSNQNMKQCEVWFDGMQ